MFFPHTKTSGTHGRSSRSGRRERYYPAEFNGKEWMCQLGLSMPGESFLLEPLLQEGDAVAAAGQVAQEQDQHHTLGPRLVQPATCNRDQLIKR